MADPIGVPIGLPPGGMRTEVDSMGAIEVPSEHYWGAQTQRSLRHFDIGDERMPLAVIRAYALVKIACARANTSLGRLPAWKGALIERAAHDVLEGRLDAEFPLRVWQTGSGTQSNMNVNEVLANRAIQLAGGVVGSRDPVHPNDDVNMGQSSNDTFPTAMHIATREELRQRLLPALRALAEAIEVRAETWASVVKVGRTHLMDATPVTVGQEWSGYAAALRDAIVAIERAGDGLLEVALGGTAVGTGIATLPGFGARACAELEVLTGQPYRPAFNHFAAQATLDPLVRTHAALKSAAVTVFKIGNDVRWLASGPRAGLGELRLPANEPGSSIMPGKVNPTQVEALLMTCVQIMGNDVAVSMAGAEGNFELNAFRPLVIVNLLQSARILGDSCDRFRRYAIDGLELDEARIARDLANSTMAVTALIPLIGYDAAAGIAHHAHAHGLPLRDAAIELGVDPADYDRIVDLRMLTEPGAH